MKKKTPEWLVERIKLGETAGHAFDPAEAGLADRIAGLRKSDEEIIQHYQPQMMKKAILEKVAGSNQSAETTPVVKGLIPGFLQWLYGAPAIKFASGFAAVMVVVLFATNEMGTQERTKGLDPHLNLYRKSGDSFEKIDNMSWGREHDVLQASYVAGGEKFGMIFSIDGRGNFTQHFPEKNGNAGLLETRGEITLPHAFELDNAPGFEKFYLVTSRVPFETETVAKVARRISRDQARVLSGRLDLPPGLKQDSFVINKRGSK